MQEHITFTLRERTSKYGERQVFQYKNKSTDKYESISWNNVLDQTNKVSKALISLGFGYDDKIGILSNNKPEWTITDLGIFAIRGVVVPFYATASKVDIKYIVDETEMKLLFAGSTEQIEKASWLLDNCETLEKIVIFEGNIPKNDVRFIEWKSFLF